MDFVFNGLERSTPSTRLPTFERGLLANQVMPGEVVGAVAEGKLGDFSYQSGVISGSVEDEFTHFHGGVGVLAGLGYNLPLFYDSGSLHFDYLYNNGNPSNNALQPYDHIFSLWHKGRAGPFGVGVDLTWADGLDARASVFGVTLLATYLIATNVIRKGDAWQAALHYQFAVSDKDNGLELQKRYEQEVVPNGFGDRYHAIYGGVTTILFFDRLQVMT